MSLGSHSLKFCRGADSSDMPLENMRETISLVCVADQSRGPDLPVIPGGKLPSGPSPFDCDCSFADFGCSAEALVYRESSLVLLGANLGEGHPCMFVLAGVPTLDAARKHVHPER